MASTKKPDNWAGIPDLTRQISLGFYPGEWETIIDCLRQRRIYLEQRLKEVSKYGDSEAVDHYSDRIETVGHILMTVYQELDAGRYAQQIQALKEGRPSWPQLANPEAQ